MDHHEDKDNSNNPENVSTSKRLERAIRLDGGSVERLTSLSLPLTLDTLDEFASAEIAARARRSTETSSLWWPDESSAVLTRPSPFIESLQGKDADTTFAMPLIARGPAAYNNYFAVIGTPLTLPSPDLLADLNKPDGMMRFAYGTKPYVARASILFPDFMKSLQETVAANGGMQAWVEAIYRGVQSPDEYPEDATLLTGSRIAYSLLAQLMRKDDTYIQQVSLGLRPDRVNEIDDAVAELRA